MLTTKQNTCVPLLLVLMFFPCRPSSRHLYIHEVSPANPHQCAHRKWHRTLFFLNFLPGRENKGFFFWQRKLGFVDKILREFYIIKWTSWYRFGHPYIEMLRVRSIYNFGFFFLILKCFHVYNVWSWERVPNLNIVLLMFFASHALLDLNLKNHVLEAWCLGKCYWETVRGFQRRSTVGDLCVIRAMPLKRKIWDSCLFLFPPVLLGHRWMFQLFHFNCYDRVC